MKIKLLALICLVSTSLTAWSQSIANSNKCFDKPDTLDGNAVLSNVTLQPEYAGGITQFYKDVVKNLEHPKDREKAPEKVIFTFIIDVKGHVRNFCFIKPEDGTYDSQIESLVEHIDQWAAGEVNNKKVNTRMLLPIIIEWK
jgi:hypothetical protein